MTNRLLTILRSWWALPVFITVAALLVVWRMNAGRVELMDANRKAEEARLRAEGQIVVERIRARDAEVNAKRMAANNAELMAALAEARAAMPGARVVGTSAASTGPRTAAGAPRPAPTCPAAPPAAPLAPAPGPEAHVGGNVAAPACLLAVGDEGDIRVEQVVMDGPRGARILVGAASAYRLTPAPRTKILSGPFRADLTIAEAVAPPPPPGWGAGVVVAAGRFGWAIGPAASLPPWSIWGVRLESTFGAAVGPGGEWTAVATEIVRW